MEQGADVWKKAQDLHFAERFPEAEAIYDQILAQNLKHAGLLASMGTLYLQTGKPGLAALLLHQAVEHGRKGKKAFCPSDVLSNLGLAYKMSGLHDKARFWLEKAVQMPDASPESIAHYGATFIEDDEESALKYLNKAIAQKPDHWIAHWNLSIALLSSGNWKKGWQEHEYGMRTKQRIDRALGGKPRWKGPEVHPGATVAIYGEQGIGDEIMFATMICDVLKTNKVVIECHQRLVTIFQKAFPGVPVYGTREEADAPEWTKTEAFDYQISMGSLGQFYRNRREDFPGTPYLKAEPLASGEKFRVGISWTGGQKAGRVRKRTVPLSWWKSILDVPNVEFVSLQYTDAQEEIDLVNALGHDVKVMDEYVKAHDYYETARLVQSCDLVITVCTSVVHLAGALGVPCWVMTPKAPAWRYQNSGPMPWYRSVRLYRKPGADSDAWLPVIEKVAEDLVAKVAERGLGQRAA